MIIHLNKGIESEKANDIALELEAFIIKNENQYILITSCQFHSLS